MSRINEEGAIVNTEPQEQVVPQFNKDEIVKIAGELLKSPELVKTIGDALNQTEFVINNAFDISSVETGTYTFDSDEGKLLLEAIKYRIVKNSNNAIVCLTYVLLAEGRRPASWYNYGAFAADSGDNTLIKVDHEESTIQIWNGEY